MDGQRVQGGRIVHTPHLGPTIEMLIHTEILYINKWAVFQWLIQNSIDGRERGGALT